MVATLEMQQQFLTTGIVAGMLEQLQQERCYNKYWLLELKDLGMFL
jgi:hypothetical protein